MVETSTLGTAEGEAVSGEVTVTVTVGRQHLQRPKPWEEKLSLLWAREASRAWDPSLGGAGVLDVPQTWVRDLRKGGAISLGNLSHLGPALSVEQAAGPGSRQSADAISACQCSTWSSSYFSQNRLVKGKQVRYSIQGQLMG